MLEKYPKDVKLVMKHFPLPNHSYARKAATAALAAAKQDKFWEMHERLYASQRELSDAKVESIAGELGLNMERFHQDLKDPGIGLMIDGEISNARQANVQGTPTIFINGKSLSQRSLSGFQEVIEAELKKKK